MIVVFAVLSSVAFSSTHALNIVNNTEKLSQERIVGGQKDSILHFPYQANILLYGQHFCGGSILSPRFILTAGHCVCDQDKKNIKIVTGSTLKENGIMSDVRQIYCHPNYEKNEGGLPQRDIAIVELNLKIKFTKLQRPIEMFRPDDFLGQGQIGVVSGWGKTEKKSSSYVLKSVDVPILDYLNCQKAYSKFGKVPDGTFCAGYMRASGEDSCQGDSGGPLAVEFRLAGVVSAGLKCGDAPGVYTSVKDYRDWIWRIAGSDIASTPKSEFISNYSNSPSGNSGNSGGSYGGNGNYGSSGYGNSGYTSGNYGNSGSSDYGSGSSINGNYGNSGSTSGNYGNGNSGSSGYGSNSYGSSGSTSGNYGNSNTGSSGYGSGSSVNGNYGNSGPTRGNWGNSNSGSSGYGSGSYGNSGSTGGNYGHGNSGSSSYGSGNYGNSGSTSGNSGSSGYGSGNYGNSGSTSGNYGDSSFGNSNRGTGNYGNGYYGNSNRGSSGTSSYGSRLNREGGYGDYGDVAYGNTGYSGRNGYQTSIRSYVGGSYYGNNGYYYG